MLNIAKFWKKYKNKWRIYLLSMNVYCKTVTVKKYDSSREMEIDVHKKDLYKNVAVVFIIASN